MGMVPKMMKRLERWSLEKNRRVFGDFTGDNGKSYFPSRKLRIKT